MKKNPSGVYKCVRCNGGKTTGAKCVVGVP